MRQFLTKMSVWNFLFSDKMIDQNRVHQSCGEGSPDCAALHPGYSLLEMSYMNSARRRILVVEDDQETAGQLVDALGAVGYEVDLACDGDDGLRRGRAASYAVMTIDRMLPGVDGLAVIRRLREEGIVTPTLIVSALGEVDDKVRGLRAGGD